MTSVYLSPPFQGLKWTESFHRSCRLSRAYDQH